MFRLLSVLILLSLIVGCSSTQANDTTNKCYSAPDPATQPGNTSPDTGPSAEEIAAAKMLQVQNSINSGIVNSEGFGGANVYSSANGHEYGEQLSNIIAKVEQSLLPGNTAFLQDARIIILYESGYKGYRVYLLVNRQHFEDVSNLPFTSQFKQYKAVPKLYLGGTKSIDWLEVEKRVIEMTKQNIDKAMQDLSS